MGNGRRINGCEETGTPSSDEYEPSLVGGTKACSSSSTEGVAIWSEVCREQASAIAVASSEAIEKRAAGSFAMALRMTSDNAGGMFGLINAGGVGNVLICCIMIATEL